MLKGSLYAEYMKERQGAELLESPEGFVFYKITGPECYISELHVAKDCRRSNVCRVMIENLRVIARQHKCEFISGNIYLADPGHKTTLIAALKLGFEMKRAEAGVISICLDVEEQE